MSKKLLFDVFDAVPELWLAIIFVVLVLLGILIHSEIKILRLIQKNYFINRDRERYAETLYASKDGYFAFIYPDEKVNDPQKYVKERCSRRLAVILDLPQGTASGFEDIIKCFYKDDAKKIQKYVSLLRDEGVSFEENFILKNSNRRLNLSGMRINANDGNLYCDMIWFRDVSDEINHILALEKEKNEALILTQKLEDIIDNLPYPVWLRNEQQNLLSVNKKYLELVKSSSKNDVIQNQTEISISNSENILKNLSKQAQTLNRIQKQNINLILIDISV